MADLTPPLSAPPEIHAPVKVMVYHPRKPRYWLHTLLLGLTLLTTLVVGARMEYNFQHNLPTFYAGDNGLDFFPWQWALHPANLALGIPFSFSLLLILLAHEMGHYLFCRKYGVWATLPFFIPFPSLFGTMGAFIRIRSPIQSRNALFDIGIAGPIAGFVVAVAVLWISLALSVISPGLASLPAIQLQYPLIFQWANYLRHGGAPLSQWNLHPMAIAAWVGMFATALNLLPGGQLDGGHLVFLLAPRAHRSVSGSGDGDVIALGLLLLGGLADLANSYRSYRPSPSRCADVARRGWEAAHSRDGRVDHADIDVYTRPGGRSFSSCIHSPSPRALVRHIAHHLIHNSGGHLFGRFTPCH